MSQKPLYILATARTGSTFLCDLLNQTGLFEPILWEHYNLRKDAGDGEWPNGEAPRNAKIMPHQMKWWFGRVTLDKIVSQFQDVHFVEVYREDIAAQAASTMYSHVTGIWNPTTFEQVQLYDAANLGFDRQESMMKFRNIYTNQMVIRDALRDFDHLTVSYEQLVAEPAWVANTVLEWIDADFDPSFDYDMYQTTQKLENMHKNELAEKIREWHEEERRSVSFANGVCLRGESNVSASALHRSNTENWHDSDLQAAQPDGLVRS